MFIRFFCFEKVKTFECSDNKRKIVLRVTRVRGFPILQLKKKSLFFCFFVFITWFFSYVWLSIANILEEPNWRNLICKVPLSHEVPFCHVVKVSGSTILLAGGLQRGPSVNITVRKGVKYLEDQNRRYEPRENASSSLWNSKIAWNFLWICMEQWGTKGC